MKSRLVLIVAAVVFVGCGNSEQDLPALILAAKEGNIEAVKQHLAAGTDVNVKDHFARTPLSAAAYFGHKEVVRLLISKGADVNTTVTSGDFKGETPLHNAAWQGHKEVAELLIAKGADVNAKRYDNTTPLELAVSGNHITVAALLRKHGGKTGEELKAEGK